jgi:FKBP-type peptidyl-prolyl cis-trans isomerase FklB
VHCFSVFKAESKHFLQDVFLFEINIFRYINQFLNYLMDKVSYALGLSLGNNLLGSGVTSLNYAKLAQGIQDVLEQNQPEISFQEAQSTINEFFTALQAKVSEQVIAQGEAFLAENAKRPEVVTLESGLQYEVITKGEGNVPVAADTVKVHYQGSLLSGQVFDSSVQRGEPATFGVTQVIAGWVEALQLMPVGSKWKLYIPQQLAYGAQGAGQAIAPYSTLVFEVELLDIV